MFQKPLIRQSFWDTHTHISGIPFAWCCQKFVRFKLPLRVSLFEGKCWQVFKWTPNVPFGIVAMLWSVLPGTLFFYFSVFLVFCSFCLLWVCFVFCFLGKGSCTVEFCKHLRPHDKKEPGKEGFLHIAFLLCCLFWLLHQILQKGRNFQEISHGRERKLTHSLCLLSCLQFICSLCNWIHQIT